MARSLGWYLVSRMDWFLPLVGGFLSYFSEIESQSTWDNIQEPKVYDTFSTILGTPNLWVRFGRYGMVRLSFKSPVTDNKDATNKKY